MIDAMRDSYSIDELCDALDVSTSGYYAARNRPPSKRELENEALLASIRSIHEHRHTRRYGSPRVIQTLKKAGHRCSENRIARLMKNAGLRPKPRKPFRPKTTCPDHAAHPSPNLLA